MFPKMGKELPRGPRGPGGDREFEKAIAAALKAELNSKHHVIKTVMRWTGASERTVKHWFAGTHGPSGQHLIALVRHSDGVWRYLLSSANRFAPLSEIQLVNVRAKLLDLIETLNGYDHLS